MACLRAGLPTCEVTCPTSYETDASSIPFKKAVIYGLQCVRLSLQHMVWRVQTRVIADRVWLAAVLPWSAKCCRGRNWANRGES